MPLSINRWKTCNYKTSLRQDTYNRETYYLSLSLCIKTLKAHKYFYYYYAIQPWRQAACNYQTFFRQNTNFILPSFYCYFEKSQIILIIIMPFRLEDEQPVTIKHLVCVVKHVIMKMNVKAPVKWKKWYLSKMIDSLLILLILFTKNTQVSLSLMAISNHFCPTLCLSLH
jgi:hypothetical protein